jgi:hypothetical protein
LKNLSSDFLVAKCDFLGVENLGVENLYAENFKWVNLYRYAKGAWKAWKRAMDAAAELGWTYEEGVIAREVAYHLPVGSRERYTFLVEAGWGCIKVQLTIFFIFCAPVFKTLEPIK